MSIGDSLHYLLIGNPLSSTVISGVSSVAKSAGIKTSSNAAHSSTKTITTNLPNAVPLWKLAGCNLNFVRAAGLSGAAAVVLAAYGTHRKYPEDKGELRSVFEVANKIHFFHTIALIAIPLVRRPVVTGSLMMLGTFLFCGPCYYRAFTGDRSLSKFAPMGGCCLILSWLSMML